MDHAGGDVGQGQYAIETTFCHREAGEQVHLDNCVWSRCEGQCSGESAHVVFRLGLCTADTRADESADRVAKFVPVVRVRQGRESRFKTAVAGRGTIVRGLEEVDVDAGCCNGDYKAAALGCEESPQ